MSIDPYHVILIVAMSLLALERWAGRLELLFPRLRRNAAPSTAVASTRTPESPDGPTWQDMAILDRLFEMERRIASLHDKASAAGSAAQYAANEIGLKLTFFEQRVGTLETEVRALLRKER